MNDPLKEIGLLIKSARQSLGMSIDDLAHESRVSSHHIINLEGANREALPEDAFLFGFLNKLLKALKIMNASKIIDKFKSDEGEYVLQSLVDDNFTEPKTIENKTRLINVYYLYIILVVIVLILAVLLINNVNKDNEKIFLSKQVASPQTNEEVKQQLKLEGPNKLEAELLIERTTNIQDELIDESKIVKENNLLSRTEEREYVYKNTYSRGKGEKSLFIRVREVAWVQVIGAHSRNLLFEGDVFPASEPNQFMFRDKEGFIVSTGNAGAFQVDTGDGIVSLGESGQLVKWYYPKSLKRKLLRANRTKID
jgi:cytoskeletal protein RodZ